MRKRSKALISIREVFRDGLPGGGSKEKLDRYHVWTRWEQLVGEAIAQHAAPHRWQGQTLVIAVASSSWLQELTFLKNDLLEKIKSTFPKGAVNDIRFELGSVPQRTARRLEDRSLPLTTRQEQSIDEAANHVNDDELKAAIRGAMRKGLQSRPS